MDYIIIVAGGKGLRMGSDIPKQFLPIGGKPVLMRTLERFREYSKDIQIILVLPESQQEYWHQLCHEYHFGVEYRLEAGYVQHSQRTRKLSYPQLYLDGFRFGATFTFLLPMHFSLQTGLLYTFTYGKNEQHWRSMSIEATQTEVIKNKVFEHNLTVPVRVYYTIPLWKKLNLFFSLIIWMNLYLIESRYYVCF